MKNKNNANIFEFMKESLQPLILPTQKNYQNKCFHNYHEVEKQYLKIKFHVNIRVLFLITPDFTPSIYHL